jgi:hypothetical protein
MSITCRTGQIDEKASRCRISISEINFTMARNLGISFSCASATALLKDKVQDFSVMATAIVSSS